MLFFPKTKTGCLYLKKKTTIFLDRTFVPPSTFDQRKINQRLVSTQNPIFLHHQKNHIPGPTSCHETAMKQTPRHVTFQKKYWLAKNVILTMASYFNASNKWMVENSLRELTYPLFKGTFEDDVPFPKVGYVTRFLEGIQPKQPWDLSCSPSNFPLHLWCSDGFRRRRCPKALSGTTWNQWCLTRAFLVANPNFRHY